MHKTYLATIGFLLLVIIGLVYKFVFQGSVEPSNDQRLAIQLDEAERNLVLGEMRTFVQSVQQITEGLSNKDMRLVATAARTVGLAAQKAVPGTLTGKLPMEFKKLGFATHGQFDQLALDAEQMDDGGHTLAQLSTLLKNCVACHATYRINTPAPK